MLFRSGLVDGVLAAVTSTGSRLPVLSSVYALTGFILVLAAPIMALLSMSLIQDPGDMPGLPRRIGRMLYPEDPGARKCKALSMLSAAILAGVFMVAVTLASISFFESMRTGGFAAVATAGTALVAGVVLIGIQGRIGAACLRLPPPGKAGPAAILVSPAGMIVLFCLVATVPAILFRDRLIDIFKALPIPLISIGMTYVGVSVATGIAARFERIPRAALIAVFIGIPVTVTSAIGVCLTGTGINHEVKRSIMSDAVIAPHSYRAARLLLDFDRDGFMGLMADGDCAPLDPNIGPGVPERPNNGRDEDCDGEDLTFDEERDTFWGRWDFEVPPAIRGRKYNIFLITIDAAAPARMSLYGYDRPTTPFLQEFASTAAWFRSAWSAGPSTRLAIPEMMTSKYGPQVDRATGFRVPLEIRQGNTTMAEFLKRAGFRTYAFLPTSYFSNWKGMTQGFDTVDKSAVAFDRRDRQNHTGDKVTEAFIAGMEKASKDKVRPVFMWAHYYDPHSPYTRVRGGADFGAARPDLYDAELAFVDSQIEKVIKEIDSRFEPERTVIIISADHGESFDANHATKHHGHDLHSSILHIPLLIRAPFVKPGVFDGPVSALDILPTLLNIEGIKGRHKLAGTSLVPQLVEGKDDPDRTIYSMFYLPENIYHDLNPDIMIGVRTREYNWFKEFETSVEHLYQYLEDPFEERNLIDDMPFKGREMRRKGAKFMLWLERNSPGNARGDKPGQPPPTTTGKAASPPKAPLEHRRDGKLKP